MEIRGDGPAAEVDSPMQRDWYPFRYTCTVERTYIDEGRIPALVFYKNDTKKPLVICLHGFTGNKESMLTTCLMLADAGFVAVSIDAEMHGERRDPDIVRTLSQDPTQLFRIFTTTVDDVGKVIDYAGENLRVDVERVGMMGVSMGAIITLLAATAEERLKAIVSVIGGANFQVLAKKSSLYKIGFKTRLVTKFAQFAGDLIGKYDPVNKAHLFRSMPVLLLNGELDDLIPLECASSLYEALKPNYQDTPDKLRMKVYKGVGHEYTSEMEKEAVEWLKKNLSS